MSTMLYDDVVAALRGKGKCMGAVNPQEYHAWKARLAEEFGCPVVSKSALADFYRSAYRYRWNEQHAVKKEGKGLRIGSMVDTLVLTPHLWESLYTHPWLPKEEKRFKLKKNGEPSKTQDPAQKEQWETEEAEFSARCEREGITMLKDGEEEEMREIAAQATDHLEDLGLVLGVSFVSQVGLWLYVEEIGGQRLEVPLIVTAMLDVLPDAAGTHGFGRALLDLKTTSANVEDSEKLCYTMEDFLYGLQGALYLDVFNLVTGETRDAFGFLFVSNSLPALSRLVVMDDAALTPYRHLYVLLLLRFAAACKLGDWGSPQLETVPYVPSRKEVQKYATLMNGQLV